MRLVKPKKFLGQHFLKDLKVAQDIADTVDVCPGLPVLEVGPGMGVLTQFLVKKERPVKVVELDYESVAYLREEYPSLEDNIIEDDFLKMNLQRLFNGQPFVLTGNYPYNISSQIFFKMLDNKELIPCCTGMIQKEVAERIAAGPGSKTYGILSILIQAWYRVEYLFTVHEHVFNPPPKEKSADIRIAQYESNTRTPKEELLRKIAEVLDVNYRSLYEPTLYAAEDVMYTLFELDEHYPGTRLYEVTDTTDPDLPEKHMAVSFRYRLLDEFLKEWQLRKKQLREGEITKEEYLEWKLNWPQTADGCGRYEPKKKWRKE